MTESVTRHYDAAAGEYTTNRERGLLGRLVATEKNAVLRALALEEGHSVLDAGCGSGIYSELIRQRGARPTGIDISPAMIEIYRSRGFGGRVANLEDVDPGETFDRILCAGSLEFVRDAEAALKNLMGFLSPSGFLIWLYPRRGLMGLMYKLYHVKNGLRVRLFSESGIRRFAERQGYRAELTPKVDPLTGIARLENT